MDPAFHDQLNLKSNGQTVVAGGPCNWDDDDESAEIRNVTVHQGGVVASNRGPTKVQKGRDKGWWLDVDASGQFTDGRALTSAVAVVTRTNKTTYEFSWPDEAQLVQPDRALDLNEIQGNIFAGFNKDFASFLFFALPADQTQARKWLADLVGQVATTEEVQRFNDLFRAIRDRSGREGIVEAAWMNLAFTHEGLRALGVAQHELGQFPEEFRQGMRQRAREIGDVGDNHPSRWPNGLGKATIHALMIVAADSIEDRNRRLAHFIRHAARHGVTLVFQQDGMTRRDAPGYEHFGFKDGISQPGIRGFTVPSDPNRPDEAWPGQELIAPGEFVLGYPRQGSPEAEQPTPYATPRPDWTRNGSYLVFRRLRQDVKAFQDFVAEQAGEEQSVELSGAKLIGRYRSGAPLEGAENAAEDPAITDPAVLDKNRINAFRYATDPEGAEVPRAAHIRKTYPRDQRPPREGEAVRRRILRRGIPFGRSFHHGSRPDSLFGADPQFPDDRGLCFVCYQGSILHQFEHIQRIWANQDSFPEPGDGVDPIVSHQWVTTTAGEYFFSPSISALQRLSR
jgi:Dyp-type peroxidase family